MEFIFNTVPKFIFGNGTISQLASVAAELGDKFLIVTRPRFVAKLSKIISQTFEACNINYVYYFGIDSEPTVEMVDELVEIARNHQINGVIAIGGGSVIDAAKAVAACYNNSGSVYGYMDGVEYKKDFAAKFLPLIAVPTTSGTGSESTANAVISCKEKAIKRSIRSPQMFPKAAIIDTALLSTVPQTVTAFTGMDTITQLIESYTSKSANEITRALALLGLKYSMSLKDAYQSGDAKSRENMAMAAYISGVCLSNGGLGAVHGMASPIGAVTQINHGLICGILLPYVMQINCQSALKDYADIGRIFSDNNQLDEAEAAKYAINYIRELNTAIGIPQSFKKYQVQEDVLESIAAECKNASMSNNPTELNQQMVLNLFKIIF